MRKKHLMAASLAAAFLAMAPVPAEVPCFAPSISCAAARVQTDEGWIRGQALRPGDCIGIVAPASPSETEDLQQAAEFLRKQGYRLKFSPFCDQSYQFFAGTDSDRASELNDFFRDDEVKAILCARGRYGAARILNRLDYEMIAKHPKLFIGFSDITALHIALSQRCHLVTVHGPMLISFTSKERQDNFTGKEFLRGLTNAQPLGEIPLPPGQKLETLHPGLAEGPIIGGNLCLISSLVGTPYELQGDGSLLLIEEVGEETAYRIDRMMLQLWQSGLLSRVKGLLIGTLTKADDDQEPGDPTALEVVTYYARLAGIPAIQGVPSGHEKSNLFLPLGVRARMEAKEDGTASLKLLEPALTETPAN